MTQPRLRRLREIASSLLKDAAPRSENPPLTFSDSPGPVPSDERAVAAIGSLLLLELIRHGGCALPLGPAQRALRRLMESFPETDRHRLEMEAVEILLWLEDSLSLLGDEWQEVDDRGLYPWEDRVFPDAGKTDRIRRAIEEESDLEIEYFTYSRNALTRRRVTPLAIEGGSKLRALCHWRRQERSFLLRRIKEIRRFRRTPVGGKAPEPQP